MSIKASYDDYLRRIMQSNKKIGYTDFLRFKLKDDSAALTDALTKAKTDAVKSESGYGTTAEKLAGLSLTKSGYSEYLDASAKADYEKAKKSAESDYEAALNGANTEYRRYESDYASSQGKLVKSTVKEIGDLSLKTYDEMLKYATGAGLSAEYAKTAADTAYATRQETLRQNMLTMIVERGWGGTKTYEYAIMVGLEEKIAKELSDYAKKLQATDLSSDYLNQVKNKN